MACSAVTLGTFAFGGGTGQPGPPGAVDPQADQMNMSQGPGQVADEGLPGAKNQVM